MAWGATKSIKKSVFRSEVAVTGSRDHEMMQFLSCCAFFRCLSRFAHATASFGTYDIRTPPYARRVGSVYDSVEEDDEEQVLQ